MKQASGLETCTKLYFLFIFNLVWIRIRKTLLFWLCNLMTSPWKPSIVVFHAKIIHTMRRRQNALWFHKWFESRCSPDFFRLLLFNCLNWKIHYDDYSSLWSSIIIHKSRMKWGLKNPIKCHHIPFSVVNVQLWYPLCNRPCKDRIVQNTVLAWLMVARGVSHPSTF